MNDVYDFLKEYLPTLIDPVVVEIGAARGEDTPKIISLLNGDWEYYAFEPDPRNVAILRERAGAANWSVCIFEAAVGAAPGTATLYQSVDNHPWSSSIRKPKIHLQVSPAITFEQSCEVNVVTLDGTLGGLDRVDFLWCDAQGSELDILKGAVKMLPRIKYMYLEYSDEELYEGQGLYDDINLYTKDQFEVVRKFDETVPTDHAGNVLLRNKNAS